MNLDAEPMQCRHPGPNKQQMFIVLLTAASLSQFPIHIVEFMIACDNVNATERIVNEMTMMNRSLSPRGGGGEKTGVQSTVTRRHGGCR